MHRKDIDGLRAVAVLAVIFYHAGWKWFPGGYVGVDVFFVISGYLITTVLLRENPTHGFSLTRFYERRVRRIFPALFLVAAFVVVVGVFLFIPRDFKKVGKSLAAVTLFASNFSFWREAGYFDAPSEFKPLLHTWSLAVEEQYYILYPLALMAIRRFFSSKYLVCLSALGVISLGASIYLVQKDLSSAFYFPTSRAWEILLGGIIALRAIPAPSNKWAVNALSLAGFALVAASVTRYHSATAFPGLAALLPAAGAGFILQAGGGGNSALTKILGFRPVVFIGLISYSLYLWHWPLLVFSKYLAIRELTNLETWAVLAATFVLSALSWRFVEQPFRGQKGILSPKRLFAWAGTVMAFALALGTWIFAAQGMPGRFDPAIHVDESARDSEWNRWHDCEARAWDFEKYPELCALGADGGKPVFLLWGDSHARALASAVDSGAAKRGLTGAFATRSGCAPLLEMTRVGEENACPEFNRHILAYVRNRPELRTVFLSGHWAGMAEGDYYGTNGKMRIELADASAGKTAARDSQNLFAIGLRRTVVKLTEMNRKVVLIAQIPEVTRDVPSAFGAAFQTGRDVHKIMAPSLGDYAERNRKVLKTFGDLAQPGQVEILKIWERLCGSGVCQVVADNYPLYRDAHHLSTYGSHYMAAAFDSIFSGK